ncbi:hypothetical protein L211DRAFT_543582 [Terfezia boudieri ATCC MYA-4762]|uniref:Secreted protein n=1 Tax=Terfezia boudieri ATCC MYA-4762 TaxID=1051890 RepID=A0A3N4LWZ6_9PEZI|nr:hypothetical protein L211DRAFT_543582 [Terfezia boudieri ATCC MYA-4762]
MYSPHRLRLQPFFVLLLLRPLLLPNRNHLLPRRPLLLSPPMHPQSHLNRLSQNCPDLGKEESQIQRKVAIYVKRVRRVCGERRS